MNFRILKNPKGFIVEVKMLILKINVAISHNVLPLHAVANFVSNYFLLKINIIAKYKREVNIIFAIA